eukprot:CAMPEP_0168628376 /NCGR_PEP_ID=MMETSP0449_2-20121227/11811_1 /TAXON_ID=1082188 /ORGANISM="Strombidium rassoulzadegani, Strain ras09" /LENGTH=359 /DNA_ID=CAMNT_0008670791 /DNA_START=42 /DNA_END=1122 /DNA_ORIENTATION=-
MASTTSCIGARVQVQARAPGPSSAVRKIAAPTAPVLQQRAVATRRLPVLAAALAEDTSVTSSMDDEMDESSMYEAFAEMLDQYDHNFKRGDLVMGTVFRVDQRGAYVDIGAKGAGYCSQREFLIIKDNAKDGEISLSLRQLELSVAWQRVRQLQEEDVTVMGKVLSLNRGGLLVNVEHIKGFVPTSQLSHRVNAENSLGKEIPLKFLEVDEERQRMVFSNRKATTEVPILEFKVGDVVEGVVESILPFGAFVNLGDINGLLHISQISHELVNSVDKVLTPGDRLKVMILSKDREKGRVALSTRKLEPTPGDMLRDPALVFAKADEMAATFRPERVAEAEAAAREEEERLTARANASLDN